MRDTAFLQAQLAQIQSRHSGKVPFGPLDDLKALYNDLSAEDRPLLIGLLRDRIESPFWAYFVAEFFRFIGIA